MAIVAEGSSALTILEMDGGIGGISPGQAGTEKRASAEKKGLSTTDAHARATDNLSASLVRFQVADGRSRGIARRRFAGSRRGSIGDPFAVCGRRFRPAIGELTLTCMGNYCFNPRRTAARSSLAVDKSFANDTGGQSTEGTSRSVVHGYKRLTLRGRPREARKSNGCSQ
jgi:hypothetical protein